MTFSYLLSSFLIFKCLLLYFAVCTSPNMHDITKGYCVTIQVVYYKYTNSIYFMYLYSTENNYTLYSFKKYFFFIMIIALDAHVPFLIYKIKSITIRLIFYWNLSLESKLNFFFIIVIIINTYKLKNILNCFDFTCSVVLYFNRKF